MSFEPWVVQRQIDLQWLWLSPGGKGICVELIHAGIFTERIATRYQRLREPRCRNGVYDFRAMALSQALDWVRRGSVAEFIGLKDPRESASELSS